MGGNVEAVIVTSSVIPRVGEDVEASCHFKISRVGEDVEAGVKLP